MRCISALMHSEKGVSSCLTMVPITSHGFLLHEGTFRDGNCWRYGWRPTSMPSNCACDEQNTVEQSLPCCTTGYPIIPITKFETHCRGKVQVGSHIQRRRARLDISARGFYGGRFERILIDIRVLKPINCISSYKYLSRPPIQETRARIEANRGLQHVLSSSIGQCAEMTPGLKQSFPQQWLS